MDFAKKQLEKYGWREGRGLGKNEDGISTALKPKLKFDNAGVGHEAGKDFTNNWWERVYSSALDNVKVDSDDGKIKMQVKNEEGVEITTKTYSVRELKKKNKDLEYSGTFIKTAKLTENSVVNFKKDVMDKTVPELDRNKFKTLTDDELFAACGGRTAHKGARHGLKLSGKLSRIEKQEKMLLKKLKNVSLTDNRENIEKKIKKISKTKERLGGDIEDNINLLSLDDYDSRSSGSVTPKKKSLNRKKRSVSFSETVTSYTTHDLSPEKTENCSSDGETKPVEYTVVQMLKIKEEPSSPKVRNRNETETEGQDEGIEQDCESYEDKFNHKSFELAQNDEEKSKKSSKTKKNERATAKFLRKVAEHKKRDETHEIDNCTSCKKRKINLKCDVKLEEDDVSEVPEIKKLRLEAKQDEEEKQKSKERKKAKKKDKKKTSKEIRSITKSLNKKCRISESE